MAQDAVHSHDCLFAHAWIIPARLTRRKTNHRYTVAPRAHGPCKESGTLRDWGPEEERSVAPGTDHKSMPRFFSSRRASSANSAPIFWPHRCPSAMESRRIFGWTEANFSPAGDW